MGCGLRVSNTDDGTPRRRFCVVVWNDMLGLGKMVVASRNEVDWNNYVGRKYRRPRRWCIRGTVSVVMVNNMNQGFQVLLSFLPLGARKQLHLHSAFLINKYISTNNKLLQHFIH